MTVPNNGGTMAAPPSSNSAHPTVSYLILLVLAEYAVLLTLRYVFRNSHGG